MKAMHRFLKIALGTAAIGLASVPAQAVTVVECGGGSNCLTGTENVNLVAANDVAIGSFGLGNIGIGGSEVKFSSTTDLLDLITGQATITAGDPTTTLNQLSFSVVDGFTAAEFNLNPLTGGGPPLDFSVTFTSVDGITGQSFFTTGNQRFALLAGAGETITSVSLSSAVGFGSFTQLRIAQGVVAPIPEPGTWAMMLLGFGGMGAALRSRRRKPAGRMQFA